MVNSEILKTLIIDKLTLKQIKESSLMNLDFWEFLERLENENFENLTNDNFKYIAQKIRKSIDNQNQQYNYSNFIQLVTRLPIEKLSFFKELIVINYQKFLHQSFHIEELNTIKNLKNHIDSIPDKTHPKVAEFVKQTKEKASNVITKTQLLLQKQQELKQKLTSIGKLYETEYIYKVDYPEESSDEKNKTDEENNTVITDSIEFQKQLKFLEENFYLEDRIRERLKKKTEVEYKINLDGKNLPLSKEHVLNYLLEAVELKPEILLQKIHFSDTHRIHIHKDLVEKYMKINPLTQSILIDEIWIDFGENIYTAINIIHFNSWYEIIEMKNPMFPSKKINKLTFSDENKLHIQKLYEQLSNAE